MNRIRGRTTVTSGRRPSRPAGRGVSRRHYWLRRAGVLLVVPLLWLAWSIGGALTAPGTGTAAARLTKWGRSHGLGWVVSDTQYKSGPAKVAARPAGKIPSVSPSRPGSSHPTRSAPSSYLAPPDPIPPQAQPARPGEGFWQTLVSIHGQTAIRAAFLRPDRRLAVNADQRLPVALAGTSWLGLGWDRVGRSQVAR